MAVPFGKIHHLGDLGFGNLVREDAAVAQAYGWPDNLTPAEIVTRLVALNAERAAEEKAGTVCWLRSDYQVPRFEGKTGD